MEQQGSARQKLDRWHAVLDARGFVGTPDRAAFVCNFLVLNEFDTLAQLQDAPPLPTWEGVADLNESELA